MKRYFLVDMENVQFHGLVGIKTLTKDDTVILFFTDNCKGDWTNVDKYKNESECTILTMNVDCGAKNALDFQLVSYLGLLIGENKKDKIEYYIVSKDKGYKSSINLLSNCSNCTVGLVKDIQHMVIYNKSEFIQAKESLSKEFKSKQTVTNILDIIIKSKTRSEAERMIENKYTYNNLCRCRDILDICFGKDEVIEKDNITFNELRKNFSSRNTCRKIFNIMKLTNDINVALDMIEAMLQGLSDWRDRVQDGLKLYYS